MIITNRKQQCLKQQNQTTPKPSFVTHVEKCQPISDGNWKISVTLNCFTCYCFLYMKVPCLNLKKMCTPLWDNSEDGTFLCYWLLLEKLALPDIAYNLWQGRYLINNNNNNNNNNNIIQRPNSRIFTISSLLHEPSPTCTLKWPVHDIMHLSCATCHVTCHAVRRDSSGIKFDRVWNRIEGGEETGVPGENPWRRTSEF